MLTAENPWVEVRSPHFSVVTDAGERRGREVALHFEQMRIAFGALLSKAKVNIPVPLQIVAFRNSKEFRQFVPLWRGKPTRLSGLFQAADDRNFILLDVSTEDALPVVFHEYGHQLLHANVSTVSVWFDEGFAEYFSTIQVNGKMAEIGKAPESAGYVLSSGRMMKLADLFSVHHDSSVYNESGDHRSLFYMQSWLMVHYVYDTKQFLQAGNYLQLTEVEKKPVAEAVQKAFGMDIARLDRAVRDYWNGNRFGYYRIEVAAPEQSASYKVATLTEADAKAVLADVHLHSRDYREGALREFEDVLRLQPDHAAAHRGLGYGYLRQNQYDKAAEHFQRAAALDSKDPRVHYYSALLMNQRALREGAPPQSPEEMRKHLETAIALDPDFADAYALLAAAYSFERDYPKAIDTMKKAIERNPGNGFYAFNLAGFYAGAGNFEMAESTLRPLAGSSDRELAELAARQLAQMQSFRGSARPRDTGAPSLRAASVAPNPFAGPDVSTDSLLKAPPGDTSPTPPVPNNTPILFLKGRLVSIDCSAQPGAVLNILARGRKWKMTTRDRGKLVLIGADAFSCGWTQKNVAVNYRSTGESEGDLVSLELQ